MDFSHLILVRSSLFTFNLTATSGYQASRISTRPSFSVTTDNLLDSDWKLISSKQLLFDLINFLVPTGCRVRESSRETETVSSKWSWKTGQTHKRPHERFSTNWSNPSPSLIHVNTKGSTINNPFFTDDQIILGSIKTRGSEWLAYLLKSWLYQALNRGKSKQSLRSDTVIVHEIVCGRYLVATKGEPHF